MLNQNSQKGVTTSGKKYPLQLDVKMTSMQAEELEKVNEYRAEVDAAPLEFDPELAAIACYRSWVDISEGYGGHDWFKTNLERGYALIDLIYVDTFSENTVHSGVKDSSAHIFTTFYINYRYSPAHYEAMINSKYNYFGCSNIYSGANRIPESRRESGSAYNKPVVCVEYNLFAGGLSTPVHP